MFFCASDGREDDGRAGYGEDFDESLKDHLATAKAGELLFLKPPTNCAYQQIPPCHCFAQALKAQRSLKTMDVMSVCITVKRQGTP
jgi:hypothetical protein